MMFAIGIDTEDVRVIQFTGSFCFAEESLIKILLGLFVHSGTGQKHFDCNFFVRCLIVGQEYSAGASITQQAFKDTRAYFLANEMLSPCCGHVKAPPAIKYHSKQMLCLGYNKKRL